MIDELQKEFPFYLSQTSEKLAYFYCNRAEESRRNPESILRTLVQQLTQTNGLDIQEAVVEIYNKRKEKGQASSPLSLQECQELLIKLVDAYSQTTICLDALDEVDSTVRIRLLKALKLAIDKSKKPLKIFATSRNDVDILHQFTMFPRIDVQPDDNGNDINKFIKTTVESAVADAQLLHGDVTDQLKFVICDVLCDRSKGM